MPISHSTVQQASVKGLCYAWTRLAQNRCSAAPDQGHFTPALLSALWSILVFFQRPVVAPSDCHLHGWHLSGPRHKRIWRHGVARYSEQKSAKKLLDSAFADLKYCTCT